MKTRCKDCKFWDVRPHPASTHDRVCRRLSENRADELEVSCACPPSEEGEEPAPPEVRTAPDFGCVLGETREGDTAT